MLGRGLMPRLVGPLFYGLAGRSWEVCGFAIEALPGTGGMFGAVRGKGMFEVGLDEFASFSFT